MRNLMMGLISLVMIAITPALVAAEYDRSDWPHWADADHDCQDTRAEVLITTSTVPTTLDGCRVVTGRWVGPYSGQVFTQAGDIDIDHLVPLAEAHRSGAQNWTRQQRQQFANDPENLLPTSASANRSKGDRDPAQWLPPQREYHCQYMARWLLVKARYRLTIDPAERLALINLLLEC